MWKPESCKKILFYKKKIFSLQNIWLSVPVAGHKSEKWHFSVFSKPFAILKTRMFFFLYHFACKPNGILTFISRFVLKLTLIFFLHSPQLSRILKAYFLF